MIPCKNSYVLPDSYGYPRVRINGKLIHEHRYVYATHHDVELTTQDIIRHKCDNPRCIEITHLELGTKSDNFKDSWLRGRHDHENRKGQENANAVLIDKDVLAIRRMYEEGWRQIDLAEEFEVTRQLVWQIVHRKIWTHI